jgi:PAS domain S-box-containing protein
MARMRRGALVTGIVVVGLAASGLAFWAVWQAEQARTQAEFERQAQAAAHRTSEGLKRHEDTLYAVRNLFHFSEDVDRREFAGAARDVVQRHVGIRALEWMPLVPGAKRDAFEAAVRAEGFQGFEIKERESGNLLRRASDRAEYFPVVYIEPMAGNEAALGFDLRSGVTWPAMERIAATGEIAASGRLRLLAAPAGATEPVWGYLMHLPVYSRSLDTIPSGERRGQLRGYVLAIFHLAQMLDSFLEPAGFAEDAYEVVFIDRAASPGQQFLYHYAPGASSEDPARAPEVGELAAGLHLSVPVEHGGRRWELWFRPRAAWLAARTQTRSWLTLALGLVVTGTAAGYVFEALRRARVVGKLVDERTAELRAAQAALEADIQQRRETERQLGNIISHLPGAAFRCRLDRRLTALFASDGMFQLTGYAAEDFVEGRVYMTDLALPEDRADVLAKLAAAVAQRVAFEVEARIRDREGTVRWILVRGRPIYDDAGNLRFLEGLAIDVSALKAAEAEKLAVERRLLEAQKLESLGVLAGGIAHDFNNLLTAMLANANLARSELPADTPVATELRHIENAARRAADLCQQMLAYAGKKEIRARLLDVSDLVRSTVALLRVSVHKNTRLDLRLDDELPGVMADSAQLQQILMNLVLNAADAIGEQPGVITITTGQRDVEAGLFQSAIHRPELPAGRYVVVEVRDDGCGMTPETLARIFEPFYTTKFSGRGLGLASVLGIVQQHRGALFVESEPGRGSTFRLLLRAEAARAAKPAAPAAATAVAFEGSVLVVDDEEPVRDVLNSVLRRQGLEPLLAASGEEALRIYAGQRDQVTLVLLDLTMPGWSGERTLQALRQRNPRQRVVLMSGYSEQHSMARCAALGVSDFISKPFDVETLLQKLQPFLAR